MVLSPTLYVISDDAAPLTLARVFSDTLCRLNLSDNPGNSIKGISAQHHSDGSPKDSMGI